MDYEHCVASPKTMLLKPLKAKIRLPRKRWLNSWTPGSCKSARVLKQKQNQRCPLPLHEGQLHEIFEIYLLIQLLATWVGGGCQAERNLIHEWLFVLAICFVWAYLPHGCGLRGVPRKNSCWSLHGSLSIGSSFQKPRSMLAWQTRFRDPQRDSNKEKRELGVAERCQQAC